MATNKRKDAAALFELIDKSTLKIPKNASGSLKIPSWWSSRSNTAPVKLTTSTVQPKPAQNIRAATSTVATATTAEPVASPALRPPPASILPKDGPTIQSAGVPVKAPVYAAKTFSPATLSRTGSGNIPGTGVPIWAAAVVGAVAVVILITVFVATRHHGDGTSSDGSGSSLGTPGRITVGIGPYNPANDGPAIQGHVLPSQPNRDPHLFYLVIESYPRPEMANKAANFLANNGVDVCIEPSGGHYWLISYQGFQKMDSPSAQAFQRLVFEIGKKYPDASKKNIFPNAQYEIINRK